MGNISNSSLKLKKEDVDKLVSSTHFSSKEVTSCFHLLGGRHDIDRKEFFKVLDLPDINFFHRIFTILDSNHDGKISVEELLAGMSILSVKGTIEEKVHIAFQIYDEDRDGVISKTELSKMLKSSLEQNKIILKPGQIKSIIDFTFEVADKNGDGVIDSHEFAKLCDENRNMLSSLTMDFNSLFSRVKL
jgi:serine/threonine-protein phosphatase 2B regulatory subunit